MNTASGLSQCRQFFEGEHLLMPFIPSDLEPKIVQEEDTVFGTKNHPNSVYDINDFVQKTLAETSEDFVITGTANNYMHYYTKKHFEGCDLALFIQIPCGTGDKEIHDKIDGAFLSAKRLINSMPKAGLNLKPPKNACLLVVDSPLYDIYGNGSGWGMITDKSGRIPPGQWHRELRNESVIFVALKAIHNAN